jgi:hypothetical protein
MLFQEKEPRLWRGSFSCFWFFSLKAITYFYGRLEREFCGALAHFFLFFAGFISSPRKIIPLPYLKLASQGNLPAPQTCQLPMA